MRCAPTRLGVTVEIEMTLVPPRVGIAPLFLVIVALIVRPEVGRGVGQWGWLSFRRALYTLAVLCRVHIFEARGMEVNVTI